MHNPDLAGGKVCGGLAVPGITWGEDLLGVTDQTVNCDATRTPNTTVRKTLSREHASSLER